MTDTLSDADIFEHQINIFKRQKSALKQKIHEIDNDISRWTKKVYNIKDDYHIVIPKSFDSLEAWENHTKQEHRYHILNNRFEAYDFFISCNTYQESYHILKMSDVEIDKYVDSK